MKTPWYKRVYALYKGETFIAVGTFQEISEQTGKTIKHLRYLTYPTYIQRRKNSKNALMLFSLDETEE